MRKLYILSSVMCLICIGYAKTETVLLAREGKCVEKWTVTDGTWKKNGVWLQAGKECKDPIRIARVGDEVFVCDRRTMGEKTQGAILKYGLDGAPHGAFVETAYRPDEIVPSPDGAWLYVASAFGSGKNRIWRYPLKGAGTGELVTDEALETPRTLAFGADGCLYAANRGTHTVTVYDVSGAKAVLKGTIPSRAQGSGGLFIDRARHQLVIPDARPETFDLTTGKSRRVLKPIDCHNVFSSARVADEIVFGAHEGIVFAWNPGEGTASVRATDVGGVCSILNLDEKPITPGDHPPYVYARADRAHDYMPLMYNNPEARPFLKTGLICYPMAMDYDGDGDWDLAVANWGIPTWRGTWYFENAGNGNFRKAKKIGPGTSNISCKTYPDGRIAVLLQNKITWDFPKTGHDGFKPLKDLPWNVHYNGVRCNMWRLADFDGDGRDDIVVGIGDWKQYGWHDAYDARGNWMNGQIHGHVYWIRNESGADGAEKWGTPRIVRLENETPVDVFGNAIPMFEDWDGDGDLDLIVGDFLDNFTYYENIGTRTNPVYTSGRLLRDSTGGRLHGDLCIITPMAVDWDKDGKIDMISGEEDGRVAFYRNTGRLAGGMPVFDPPQYLRQEADKVNFGILATPSGVDWDGDGDMDVIAGNSAGYICFIENLSGPGVAEPKWAEPKLLSCEPFDATRDFASSGGMLTASPIRIMAGHNGSIQGPAEAKWGYTCLSTGDWDGDGLPDIMVNSIWGKPLLFRNIGTRTSPKLAAPVGLEVEWNGEQPELAWGWYKPKMTDNPKELITQWRTTPVMFDMNDDGLMDLVMVDVDGDLAFFERAKKDGGLILKAPRKAFLDTNGNVMHPTARKDPKAWNGGVGGATGRRKIAIGDWNGDGKPDLIMNGMNSHLYLQVERKDGNWIFADAGDMSAQQLAAHSTSPTLVDFDNDGVPEVLLGCEDGFFYHLKNNDWPETVEEMVIPPWNGHVHASSVLPLKDGGYLAVWFQGTKESASDVGIAMSRRIGGAWEPSRIVGKVADVAHWNPVLRRGDDGRIVLYFKVSAKISNWKTWIRESRDEGATWSEPRELVLGDETGGRGPVKNKCLRLKSGRWLAPASVERGPWRAFIDVSDDDGRTWARVDLPVPAGMDRKGVIQPSLWQSADGSVHALMRSNTGVLWRSDSTDNGGTWSEIRPTDIPNNNSGIDLVRASNGVIYLARNASGKDWGPRNCLELWSSSDDGTTWRKVRMLAQDKKGEFSYPAIVEARPGVLAITFTWRRSQIRFVEIKLPEGF